ncbi:MAG: glycosyltransferase family 39 protein [Dehalococcoidia bacterium]|nr:glycosyltransferase family 39 protein [Dehalococcoidia bacterium]
MNKRYWPHLAGGGYFALLALLLLAFFLRSAWLDKQSIWADEAYTLSLSSRTLWQSILNEVLGGDANTPHTPLYYLALMPWLRLVGTSDYALRWFSVAFGLLTVPVSYALARRLLGGRTAGMAALLAGMSPFLVYYSQEARMYAMAGFLAILAPYCLVKALMGGGKRWWIGYSLSATALFFTLNIGLVLIAVFFLVSLLPESLGVRQRRLSVVFHLPVGLSVLLWQVVQSSRFAMNLTVSPFQAIGLLSLDTVKDTALAYVFGVTLDKAWAVDRVYAFRDNPLQPWATALQPYYTNILVLVAVGLVSAGVWKLARMKSLAFPLLVLGVVSVIASVLMLRLTTISYGVRLTLIAAPLFLILLSAGVQALPGLVRIPALALLILFMSYSLWQNYQNPVFSRSEYRVLAQRLGEEMEDGDAVYLHGPVLRLLDRRYLTRPHPVYTIPDALPVDNNWNEVADQLESIAGEYFRVWLVLGGEADYDPERRVERWLLEHGYQVEDEWFGNSRLSLFVFPRSGGSRALSGHLVNEELAMEGATLPMGQTVTQGRSLPVALTWRTLKPFSGRYRVSIRLLDSDNLVWSQRDVDVAPSLRPISNWAVGQPVSFNTGLRLAPGIPPGDYNLKLLVYESDGRPLPHGDLDPIPVKVVHAPAGPVKRVRPPNKVDLSLGQLRIVGYGFPHEVIPGQEAGLRLYWKADASPGKDYSLAVRLGDGPEQELALLPRYPTSGWHSGDTFISQHMIRIPAEARGRQALRIGLDGQSSTGLFTLAYVEARKIERQFEAPSSMQRVYRAGFGGQVELIGADLEGMWPYPQAPALGQGSSLDLALYWRALKEMDTSYTVFVQLLDSRGRLVITHDVVPSQGQRPTMGWLPGEVVRDSHHLKLPDDLPSGNYRVITGTYDARTGNRLETATGDFLHLMDLTIGPEP